LIETAPEANAAPHAAAAQRKLSVAEQRGIPVFPGPGAEPLPPDERFTRVTFSEADRKKFAMSLAAAAVAFAPGAIRAQTEVMPLPQGMTVTTGGVLAINQAQRQFLLDNRQIYTLEPDVAFPGITPGDKVTVLSEDQEGDHMVMAITKLGKGITA
jgi:hypothetical protein